MGDDVVDLPVLIRCGLALSVPEALTAPLSGVETMRFELKDAATPLVIDFETSFYYHREGGGLLFGMGDPDEKPGFDITVRWDFLPKVIEVAMQERLSGRDPVTAATSAAGQRFRAVIMTSFAFILGLVPLVIASGAGAATQRAVGTAVFGGMLAAACLGIFVIPGLYVMFEKIRIGLPTLLRRMFRQLKRSR